QRAHDHELVRVSASGRHDHGPLRARWSHLADTSRMATSAAGREPDDRVRGARVVLADDDVLLREGLASLLERAHFVVVGQAGNAQELLALVREHEPDLALVDIRMPPTHSNEGLQAALVIRDEYPE